jgi:hypothetical protein
MPLALVWTYDHILELLVLIVGVIAAGGGIVAAIYAFKGNANTVDAARAETDRWRAGIRPAPNLNFQSVHQWAVGISNAGGAIQPGYLVVVNGPTLYHLKYSLGAHTDTKGMIAMTVLTQLPDEHRTAVGDRRPVLHIARDVEGYWWDILGGAKLSEVVPDSSGPDFMTWCESQWKAALGMRC